MVKNQLVMMWIGFIAGVTVGTSILLIALDKANFNVRFDMQPNFEGAATILAATIAVTGVWWQMSKSRLQDRQNHQYQILHKCRHEFAAFRVLLLSRTNLIKTAISNEEVIQKKDWNHTPTCQWTPKKAVTTIGNLLSFSSKLGLKINDQYMKQVELLSLMRDRGFSPDVLHKVSDEITVMEADTQALDTLWLALTENKLP